MVSTIYFFVFSSENISWMIQKIIRMCTFTKSITFMTNNDILKKLRVALKLTNKDIVHICSLVNFRVTESELGALFRKEDHPKYKNCGDQFLRNFLNGLVIHYRGERPNNDKVENSNSENVKKEI